MRAVKFPEANTTFAKNQPEYLQLPAHVSYGSDIYGVATFCWRLSWRERLSLLFRGVLWHQVLTFHDPLQPQKLMVDKPAMRGN